MGCGCIRYLSVPVQLLPNGLFELPLFVFVPLLITFFSTDWSVFDTWMQKIIAFATPLLCLMKADLSFMEHFLLFSFLISTSRCSLHLVFHSFAEVFASFLSFSHACAVSHCNGLSNAVLFFVEDKLCNKFSLTFC